MEISKRASLIFNNNGSIVVRHAFQTRDGKFHDIVVTDGDCQFRKEEWVGCEKVLLKKIWAVYSECIQEIQKHSDCIDKIAPEHVRFVYNKNPAKSNSDKTKLFINSQKGPLLSVGHAIGHWGKINEELDILSTILLQPRTMVPSSESKPAIQPTKAPKPQKTDADKAAEPKKPVEPAMKPAEPAKPTIKLPPVKRQSKDHAKDGEKPSPSSPIVLPPIKRPVDDPLVDKRKDGVKKALLSRAKGLLGNLFKAGPLKEHLT